MKKTILFFLMLTAIIVCAATCAARAEDFSMEGVSNKFTVRVGETITVKYTATGAETLTYLVKSYQEESNGYGAGLQTQLAYGELKIMSGTWSYQVKEGDGPYISVYIDARKKDPQTGYDQSRSFYQLIPVTKEKSVDAITVKMTPEASSVKAGHDISFTYQVKGGSGEYESVTAWGAIIGSDGNNGQTLRQTGLADSGTVKLEKVRGEKIRLTVEVVDKKGWKSRTVSDWIGITHIELGQSGWVQKDGKTYYGDEYGYGVEGYRTIDKEKYFFNESGELQTGWFKVEEDWRYFGGEDGRELKNIQGLESITVPEEVDQLNPKFFRGAARTFMLYCKAGSYAEKFALQYGLQYDNGEKTVQGCYITDLYEKIDWIVENYISDSMSDRQKVQVIHNWLIYNASYDETLTNYNPDGVLLKGYGVCDSYSRSFNMLMDKLGITCERISGYSRGGAGHAWNRVWIDDQWLYIDCTWDDPSDPENWKTRVISGAERQKYFLISKELMEQDHEFRISEHWSRYSWSYWYGHWLCWDRMDYDSENMCYVRVMNRWIRDIDKWYHFDADGYMQTGRQLIDGTWYFFGEDGVMQTGWINYQRAWYYFDKYGVMQTGWIQDEGNWYYLSTEGELAVGWLNDGGYRFYLDKNGILQTGWFEVDQKWYCADEKGVIQTGWIQDGEAWYLMKSDTGEMTVGWATDGNGWYYFNTSGIMAADEWISETVDGKTNYYWVDKNGIAATGWSEIDGQWEFFDNRGVWQYSWTGES